MEHKNLQSTTLSHNPPIIRKRSQTYLTSNLNAGKTLYNAETSNGTTLFTGLLNSAVASMTGSLNAGMGLVGDVLSGAATYASSFNSGSTSIESGAITTSKNLSTQEIDARIKYYKAVSKADKTRKDALITIDADRRKTEINIVYAAARDKIDERLNDDEYYYYSYYTGHYAAGVQVYLGQYTYDYDYDYGYGIGYFDGGYYYGSSTYYYPVMGSSYGSTTSYYFGGYYSGGYPVYGLYAGTNTDLPQIKANNDWAALKNLGADAVQTASKLAAKATYTTTYMGIYRSSVSAAWNVAGQYLDLDISTATTLDDKLWNDCSTANNALISTARADNSLGSMISSAKTSVSNEVNYSKSSGSNFGQYQVNWRQELATANPGNTALQQDVQWARDVKSARDTYYSLLGTATTGYTGTVFDAVEDYSDTMFEAGITRSLGHFSNAKTYSTSVRSAGNTYSRAAFNASKDASLGYLDAAIAEIVGVANEESKSAGNKASRVTGKIFAVTPGNGGANSGTSWNTMILPYTNSTTLLGTVRADLTAQDANDRTKLTQKKAELATQRKTKEKEVQDRYTKAEQTAWNSYNTSVIVAQTTYANQFKAIETVYQNTAKNAENTYTTVVMAAIRTFASQAQQYENQFYATLEQAGASGSASTGGTNPYQMAVLNQANEIVDNELNANELDQLVTKELMGFLKESFRNGDLFYIHRTIRTGIYLESKSIEYNNKHTFTWDNIWATFGYDTRLQHYNNLSNLGSQKEQIEKAVDNLRQELSQNPDLAALYTKAIGGSTEMIHDKGEFFQKTADYFIKSSPMYRHYILEGGGVPSVTTQTVVTAIATAGPVSNLAKGLASRVVTRSSVGEAFVVNPSKYDYFFGRVITGSKHNISRSAQNLKDLTTLGIENEMQLLSVFSSTVSTNLDVT